MKKIGDWSNSLKGKGQTTKNEHLQKYGANLWVGFEWSNIMGVNLIWIQFNFSQVFFSELGPSTPTGN